MGFEDARARVCFHVRVRTSHAPNGRDRGERVGAVVEGVGHQRGRGRAGAHGVGDAEEPLLPGRGRVRGGGKAEGATLRTRRNRVGGQGRGQQESVLSAAPRAHATERGAILVPAGAACRRSTTHG